MVQSAEGVQTERGQRNLIQLITFGIVFGLVIFGFVRYVLAPPESSSAPQYVGTLKLTSIVEGDEAKVQINKLHGTNINLENAFIAAYQPPYGGEHLMVWVGEAANDAEAENLLNRMVEGIKRGGAGYSNPRLVQAAGLDIWQADGEDGSFFFYISQKYSNRVVWFTIEGSGSVAALLERAVSEF